MTSRKRPGVAFWATVVMVMALAYLLSMGVSYRMLLRWSPDDPESRGWRTYRAVYAPIIWAYTDGPEPFQQMIDVLCGDQALIPD